MSERRIVANLDFERTIAPAGGRHAKRLTPAAGRSAALLGTLMRVFAVPGDRLWLPSALPTGRVSEVEGIPTPSIESGDLRRLAPASGWLAWGETEPIAALRARDRADPGSGADPEPLWRRIWRFPRPVPTVVRHVHHRHTHTVLARELGYELPGQRWIDSVESLEEHLAAGGAALSSGEHWILKPAFSAAGRDWVRGEGRALLPSSRTQLERALAGGEAFLFEPRLDRVRDIGVALVVSDYGVEIAGRHDLETGQSGRFRAVRILAPDSPEPEERFPGRVVEAAVRIGERLIALGFRGACGLDAWLGRTADGSLHAQLLGEINARLTFGWLLHAWRERLVEIGRLGPTDPIALRTGAEGTPPREAIPLVLPGDHDTLSAWLESGGAADPALAARGGTR